MKEVVLKGLRFVVENNEASLVECDKEVIGKVEIPSTIEIEGESYPVTVIARKAFYFCRKITSVIIPNSVKCVEALAFHACTVNSVVLPNYANLHPTAFVRAGKLHTQDGLAFGNIYKYYVEEYYFTNTGFITFHLRGKEYNNIERVGIVASKKGLSGDIKIPSIVEINGKDYLVSSICNFAFYNRDISSVVIPESVRFVAGKSFFNCKNLKTAFIHDEFLRVVENAFEEGVEIIKNKR